MAITADFALRAPATVDEVLALQGEHGEDAMLLAGGTSVVLLLKNRLVEPSVLVDLRRVADLRGIAVHDGTLVIGAMATLREVETSPLVQAHAPMLAEAVRRVATVRIRNQATIGGNVVHADPASDPPPALLALDAVAEVAGPGGRREVPLDGFFTDVFETVVAPDELLVAIRIPPAPAGSRAAYLPFQPRTVDDYATVAVAARLDIAEDRIADARLAVAACGPVPFRVHAAEAALRGAPADAFAAAGAIEAAADLAVEAADPTDDVRGSADYKRDMLRVHVVRALRALLDADAVAALGTLS